MGWDGALNERTYISSISPGVRRVTSGRMNHAITTETAPVPAKLNSRQRRQLVSGTLSRINRAKHSQETRLDTPSRFGDSPVDHQRRAEAEHDGNEIGRREGPARGLGTQAPLGDFDGVGVADG